MSGIIDEKIAAIEDELDFRSDLLEYRDIFLNTRLLTRDGRRIGNAIVCSVDHNAFLQLTTYRCKTDYGNEFVFTRGEIIGFFFVGDVAKPDHKHYTSA